MPRPCSAPASRSRHGTAARPVTHREGVPPRLTPGLVWLARGRTPPAGGAGGRPSPAALCQLRRGLHPAPCRWSLLLGPLPLARLSAAPALVTPPRSPRPPLGRTLAAGAVPVLVADRAEAVAEDPHRLPTRLAGARRRGLSGRSTLCIRQYLCFASQGAGRLLWSLVAGFARLLIAAAGDGPQSTGSLAGSPRSSPPLRWLSWCSQLAG